MSVETQEGIVMMILLLGMVIGWGIWIIRMLRQMEWEEHLRQRREQQARALDQQRHLARNYRYSDQ
jgi:biopolymer transport protein ExbB/TolQ